ncbi:MAG TPA: hypothetical protein VGJ54_06525 [Streptosporangiaceae bacterium]
MTDVAAASASAVVPGVLGFLIVAGMGVALFFLLRSMNKQLRKVVPGPKWRENGQGQEPGAAATQDSKPNGTSGA